MGLAKPDDPALKTMADQQAAPQGVRPAIAPDERCGIRFCAGTGDLGAASGRSRMPSRAAMTPREMKIIPTIHDPGGGARRRRSFYFRISGDQVNIQQGRTG